MANLANPRQLILATGLCLLVVGVSGCVSPLGISHNERLRGYPQGLPESPESFESQTVQAAAPQQTQTSGRESNELPINQLRQSNQLSSQTDTDDQTLPSPSEEGDESYVQTASFQQPVNDPRSSVPEPAPAHLPFESDQQGRQTRTNFSQQQSSRHNSRRPTGYRLHDEPRNSANLVGVQQPPDLITPALNIHGAILNPRQKMASEAALELLDVNQKLNDLLARRQKEIFDYASQVQELQNRLVMANKKIEGFETRIRNLEHENTLLLGKLRAARKEKEQLQRETDATLSQIEANLNAVLLNTMSQSQNSGAPGGR